MREKIAIKPHNNRGNEIIKIFENRGFRNPCKYDGNYSENITKDYAFIGGCDGAEDCIILTDIVYLENIGYKICTLEEYENEYKAMEEETMWKTIKNILAKKACFHEWKLVKENRFGSHYHYVYICQKCGDIKVIEIK